MTGLYNFIALVGMLACPLKVFAQGPCLFPVLCRTALSEPGFLPALRKTHRFYFNYRNQWPNLIHGYETYAFSYDYNLMQYHSGIGFMAVVDKAGTAGMKSAEFNFCTRIS